MGGSGRPFFEEKNMKIKIKSPMAGVGISYKRNQIVDVDDAEGARLCAAGRAEPVKKNREKALAKASINESEKAVIE